MCALRRTGVAFYLESRETDPGDDRHNPIPFYDEICADCKYRLGLLSSVHGFN